MSSIAASSARLAQPHRGLQVHPADLRRRPAQRPQGRTGAARLHRLRRETVGLAQDQAELRRLHVRQRHEDVVALARQARPFHVRPHHHAGGVAQHEDGDVEGVAELREAAELVGAGAVDGAAEVLVVVGDDADRVPLDADERRHHPDAELRPQLQHRAGVGQQLDHLAHLEGAQAVLRDHVAQQALVGALPLVDGALEVGEVLLRGGDRLVVVLDEDVHRAGRPQVLHGTDLLWQEQAQAAALDRGGAAHTDVGVPRRVHAVQDLPAWMRCRRRPARR